MSEFLTRIGGAVVGLDIRLSPIYLVSTLAIGFAIFRISGAAGSFLSWFFPARVYFHRSHLVDIELFVVGRALTLLGVFNAVGASTFAAAVVMHAVGGEAATATVWHPVLVAALILLVNDFGVYWVHRVHHETAALWPFHAVHHSAEVLTPVTVYRKHPVYDLISRFVRSLLFGAVQGLMLGLFVGRVDVVMIAGVNVLYVAFNLLGSNLRHTHVWLSYGPILEHVLISPAQHQIHHSLDRRHVNTNYGEILAIWDWAFGSLYVPHGHETLAFGLSDETGAAIAQPHGTLRAALLVPFRDSWRAVRGRGPRTVRTDSAAGA